MQGTRQAVPGPSAHVRRTRHSLSTHGYRIRRARCLSPVGHLPWRSARTVLYVVLYVGHRGSADISSFRIDQDTGGLSQNGKVSLEAAPTFLSTDRTGRCVLSTYEGEWQQRNEHLR
jgi:6-phosphogluconolactonase (cycloisomerase 2 family)